MMLFRIFIGLPAGWGGRTSGVANPGFIERGGTPASGAAVLRALRWLKKNPLPDGSRFATDPGIDYASNRPKESAWEACIVYFARYPCAL